MTGRSSSGIVESIDPLRLVLEVGCAPEHAFEVWTARISTWWPADPTVTGAGDLDVILEPRVGGRIYERTPDGTEHDWGWVTVWDPPGRLAYRWHLRRDRADATEVEIRFLSLAAGRTRVEIEHRDWERMGAEGPTWRDRNAGGWATLLPQYEAAVDR
jgi:hypothetical protein